MADASADVAEPEAAPTCRKSDPSSCLVAPDGTPMMEWVKQPREEELSTVEMVWRTVTDAVRDTAMWVGVDRWREVGSWEGMTGLMGYTALRTTHGIRRLTTVTGKLPQHTDPPCLSLSLCMCVSGVQVVWGSRVG